MKNLLTFSLLLCYALTYAQQPVRDTSVISSKPRLTLAGIYSSDINYYGQTTVGRLPYVLAYAGLGFNSGFYLSASGYKVLNSDGATTGAGLTAGYDFNLTKNLSAGLSYTRSFFPDSSFFLQAENLNMFSGKLGYNFNWLNAGFSVDYSPGQDQAFYSTFDLKKSIELIALNKSAFISIEPAFEINGSTQQITSSEEVPASNGGNGIIKLPLQRVNQRPEYRTVRSTSFGILSYGLKLPLAYNTSKFTAEAGYQMYVNPNGDGSSQSPRSLLSLGLYYVL